MPHLLALPNELWRYVGAHLLVTDVLRLSETCRALRVHRNDLLYHCMQTLSTVLCAPLRGDLAYLKHVDRCLPFGSIAAMGGPLSTPIDCLMKRAHMSGDRSVIDYVHNQTDHAHHHGWLLDYEDVGSAVGALAASSTDDPIVFRGRRGSAQAFRIAAINGHVRKLDWLVAHGADVSNLKRLRDHDEEVAGEHQHPLEYACANHMRPLAAWLVDHFKFSDNDIEREAGADGLAWFRSGEGPPPVIPRAAKRLRFGRVTALKDSTYR